VCQEIFIDATEAERQKDCWCALSAEYPQEVKDQALKELGGLVVAALLDKTASNRDSSEITITVTLKRW
jgi:hypothetical protein